MATKTEYVLVLAFVVVTTIAAAGMIGMSVETTRRQMENEALSRNALEVIFPSVDAARVHCTNVVAFTGSGSIPSGYTCDTAPYWTDPAEARRYCPTGIEPIPYRTRAQGAAYKCRTL